LIDFQARNVRLSGMEKGEKRGTYELSGAISAAGRLFTWLDDIILIIVCAAIIVLAAIALGEAFTDFINFREHSIPHTTSDLMFVLIIMELSRQVLGQLHREQFSLNPFLFIGVIASIRGILIMQMRLSLEEVEWTQGITQMGIYATIVLILVLCYYLTTKTEKTR